MCGYLPCSLAKFRRALAGEMLGYMEGYRPISAHRFIFLASRCSRICGRAFNSIFLSRNSRSARFSRQDSGASFCSNYGNFV